MLKKILYIPYLLVRAFFNLSTLINSLYNTAVFKHNNIIYSKFPIIVGRIVLKNHGTFKIGRDIRFNCSVKSNYVGLTKTCTVYVETDAIFEVGDYSGFSGVSIVCFKQIKIGKHVNCGGNVFIWDTDFHPLGVEDRRVHNTSKITSLPIYIGDDVFIGANSIILKGVSIGDKSIIGAGSVVTKNVPEGEIWAGNPAKFIRKISDE